MVGVAAMWESQQGRIPRCTFAVPPQRCAARKRVLVGRIGALRQALVVFQFATLIGLIVATLTSQRQTQYAIEDRLRLPSDTIYIASGGCLRAFVEAVAQLPGVRAASCASSMAVAIAFRCEFLRPEGHKSIETATIDYEYFSLFGVKPVAGRLLAKDHGQDDVLQAGDQVAENPAIVLNESVARALGFESSEAAVGQYKRWTRPELAGIVPICLRAEARRLSASSRIFQSEPCEMSSSRPFTISIPRSPRMLLF